MMELTLQGILSTPFEPNGSTAGKSVYHVSEHVFRMSPVYTKITFRDEIPAMSPRPENYELLEVLDRVSQDLGLGKIEPLDPGKRGAGDISFIADLLPGLDGLGATGGKEHAKGEYADLDTLARQTKRAAILIYRLTRSHPQPQRSQ